MGVTMWIRAARLLLVLVVAAFFVGMPLSISNPAVGMWLCAPGIVCAALFLLAIVGLCLCEAIHWAWTGNSWLISS